jgi:hypothetical protein
MFPTLNQMVAQVSIPKLILEDKLISKCTSTGKDNLSSVQALKDLFLRYAECSGQHINSAKSTIYSGAIFT